MQVRNAMRKLRFRRPINWVFNPAAGVVAGRLGEERVIYYCVDEYTALNGVPSAALAKTERSLLRRADLVVASAVKLKEAKGAYNHRTVLVRHGVDYDHFRKALDRDGRIPPEIANLPRPILGYFGLMSADWVDVEALMSAAKAFPGGSLVLLGKKAMDLSALEAMPNVHVLGRKPYADLPDYCRGFDVGLIPFPITEATLHSNPLKAREYLAAGLPVVSTAIPEVATLPHCRIAKNSEDFVAKLHEALLEPGPSRARSETMASEGWAARLDEIRAHYEELVAHRAESKRVVYKPSGA
jgi:glycosyltransferase involved in cell wall biosynthesis